MSVSSDLSPPRAPTRQFFSLNYDRIYAGCGNSKLVKKMQKQVIPRADQPWRKFHNFRRLSEMILESRNR